MEFAVVKSPSPYNALLSRTGMRSLGAVASTIHSMIKFPTSNGIATIATTRETLRECRKIEEAQALSWHTRVTDPTPMQTSSKVINPKVSLAPVETRPRRPGKEPMQLDDTKERRQLDKGMKPPKSGVEEKIVVNDNYLEQLITIRGGLSAKCRHALIHTLRKNVDVFAWIPSDMTGIPKAITEHSLDTYPYIEPKVQKKRSLTPDRRKVVTDEVNEWIKADIVRRVRYPTWVSNPMLVKKINWEIKSLMGFQYKCFLDAYKGYHQIQMTKKDEEKKAFHTEEGVFCYTKMPFGLKNAGVTYQRLVDSAFKERIRVNLEAYVDDMVIKSRTEQDIIKHIEQTFSTLQRINVKLNPKKCSFRIEEGKFLGYIVTSYVEKCTNKKDFRWTKAAEAAFLEMKKLVFELPTLTTPKKGKTLMMYLAAANEAVSAVLLTERDRRKMHIHYVLNTSGASRRLAKWAVELGAYGITYVPRVAVKGSRAGLILIAPDDVEYSYALHLNFSNSNNDPEYEALLAGLRIAKEMQVKDIHAFMYSKLMASQVEGFRIIHILRAENRKADALSKLVAVQFDHLSKEVLVEKGKLPEDPVDARTLMEKIVNYMMEDDVVAKAMNLGYYWPSMHRDATELIRACDDCQAHASVPRLPKADMISVTSTWPFMKFGIPATIITDNETRFVNDPFKKWAEKLKIQLISTLVYHPQGNGAVERANKSLLRGIKTRLEKGGSAWAEEVPNVLWAHRTIKKTSNGETPFSLTYGTEAFIPAEIGMPTHRTYNVNEKTNDQELRLNLDLLDEKREITSIREARNEVSRAANTCKLGPTWEGPYKVIQAFQSGAYKLSNMEGEPGMLATSKGATCKTPKYLYCYYVSLSKKQFSKYRLAPEAEQPLLIDSAAEGRGTNTSPFCA
ncbi:reverse transcriptase domain-containing protein [Tanacetum coccineum]